MLLVALRCRCLLPNACSLFWLLLVLVVHARQGQIPSHFDARPLAAVFTSGLERGVAVLKNAPELPKLPKLHLFKACLNSDFNKRPPILSWKRSKNEMQNGNQHIVSRYLCNSVEKINKSNENTKKPMLESIPNDAYSFA